MKTILKIGLLLFAPVLLWKCESEMMGYEGKDGVYFMMQTPPPNTAIDQERWEYVDTTHVSFASILGEDTVLQIRVRVMGNVTEHERHVSLRIVDKETTAKPGEDYDAFELNPVVAANERQVEVPCRIVKTEKLAEDTLTLALVLELEANDDFTLPLLWWEPFGDIAGSRDSVNVVRHVILISNEVKIPNWWPEEYWGKWSPKKFGIMSELFSMTWKDFNELNRGDEGRAKIMGQNLDKYLKEREKDGKTIYEDERDENGDLVKMTAGKKI